MLLWVRCPFRQGVSAWGMAARLAEPLLLTSSIRTLMSPPLGLPTLVLRCCSRSNLGSQLRFLPRGRPDCASTSPFVPPNHQWRLLQLLPHLARSLRVMFIWLVLLRPCRCGLLLPPTCLPWRRGVASAWAARRLNPESNSWDWIRWDCDPSGLQVQEIILASTPLNAPSIQHPLSPALDQSPSGPLCSCLQCSVVVALLGKTGLGQRSLYSSTPDVGDPGRAGVALTQHEKGAEGCAADCAI